MGTSRVTVSDTVTGAGGRPGGAAPPADSLRWQPAIPAAAMTAMSPGRIDATRGRVGCRRDLTTDLRLMTLSFPARPGGTADGRRCTISNACMKFIGSALSIFKREPDFV